MIPDLHHDDGCECPTCWRHRDRDREEAVFGFLLVLGAAGAVTLLLVWGLSGWSTGTSARIVLGFVAVGVTARRWQHYQEEKSPHIYRFDGSRRPGLLSTLWPVIAYAGVLALVLLAPQSGFLRTIMELLNA